MPDITMCFGENCPKKESCYRFTAEAHPYRQSYFMVTPLEEDNTCNHYWEDVTIKPSKQKKGA